MTGSLYRRLHILWSWFVRIATDWLPDSTWTMRLRGRLYGLFMKECGKDFQVGSRVTLVGLHHISVGDHVYLAPGVVVLASNGVTFEDEVMVAYYTLITDGNHTPLNASYRFGPRDESPVHIGRGAWVSAHCTVLPGVSIGCGTVVGANSAVTGSLPSGSTAGGVPARLISRKQVA